MKQITYTVIVLDAAAIATVTTAEQVATRPVVPGPAIPAAAGSTAVWYNHPSAHPNPDPNPGQR